MTVQRDLNSHEHFTGGWKSQTKQGPYLEAMITTQMTSQPSIYCCLTVRLPSGHWWSSSKELNAVGNVTSKEDICVLYLKILVLDYSMHKHRYIIYGDHPITSINKNNNWEIKLFLIQNAVPSKAKFKWKKKKTRRHQYVLKITTMKFYCNTTPPPS